MNLLNHLWYGLTSLVPCDKHLATDQRDLDMVNPDLVSTIQRNSITTPDILRVELGNVDVLYDSIANTIHEMQPLITNHASTANTHGRLIRGNIDTLKSRLVVSACRSWVASAPGGRIQVDRILTGTATLVGRRDAAFADGAFTLVV